MIRATHNKTPQFTVSAYSDNAAVIEGDHANVWAPDYSTGSWKLIPEVVHILTKVEVWFLHCYFLLPVGGVSNKAFILDAQPPHGHLVGSPQLFPPFAIGGTTFITSRR